MENAVFKQGIWEIGEDYIQIFFQQGPWRMERKDMEVLYEQIRYEGSVCIFGINVKPIGKDEVWPLGELGPNDYPIREALLSFAGKQGVPYRTNPVVSQMAEHAKTENTKSETIGSEAYVSHNQGTSMYTQSFRQKKRKDGKKWVGILAGGIFIVVLAFLLMSGGGGKKETAIEPSEKPQEIKAGEVSVTLPGGTIVEKTEMTVSPVKDAAPLPGGNDGVSMKVYDITFTKEQEVIGVAEIELPFDKEALPSGVDPEKCVGALYFNPETSAWEGMPCRVNVEKGTIIITTDHFSRYASVVTKSGSKGLEAKIPDFVYVPMHFYDDETLKKIVAEGNANAKVGKTALVKGWDKFNELYNITGQGSTLIEKTLEVDAMAGVNEMMNEIGLGFALGQLAYDLYTGEKQDAAINLTKNTMYYSISKWGSRGLNIMGVGLFAVDYSLTQMGNEVKQTNYENWKKAYDLFYQREHPRGAKAWYKIIMDIGKKAKGQQEFQDMLVKEVEDYLNLFWQDEEVMARYIAEVKGSFVKGAGGGGLAMAKEDVIGVARQELYTTYLPVALNCALKNLAFHTQMAAEEELDKLKAEFNKMNTVVVQAQNIEKVPNVQNVKVRFINQQNQVVHEMTLDSEGKATLRMTLFGFLQSGSPNKVQILIPSDGKSEDRTIDLSYKFKKPGDTLIIPVNLGFNMYGTWMVKNVTQGFTTSWIFSDEGGGTITVSHLAASTRNFKYTIKDGKIHLTMKADYAAVKGGKKTTHEEITIDGTISEDGNKMTTQAVTHITGPNYPKGFTGKYKVVFTRKSPK